MEYKLQRRSDLGGVITKKNKAQIELQKKTARKTGCFQFYTFEKYLFLFCENIAFVYQIANRLSGDRTVKANCKPRAFVHMIAFKKAFAVHKICIVYGV